MYLLSNMMIFHCHVSLLEGTSSKEGGPVQGLLNGGHFGCYLGGCNDAWRLVHVKMGPIEEIPNLEKNVFRYFRCFFSHFGRK